MTPDQITAALAALGDTPDAVAASLLRLGCVGVPGDQEFCPLACHLAALGAWKPCVMPRAVYLPRLGSVPLPEACVGFVLAFDAARYPNLYSQRMWG